MRTRDKYDLTVDEVERAVIARTVASYPTRDLMFAPRPLPPTGEPFKIELVYRDDVSDEQEARFQDATDYFMTVLADTEVPPVEVDGGLVSIGGAWCRDLTESRVVSGLLVVVTVTEGEHLAAAGPCARRTGGLPVVGRMNFTPEYLAWTKVDEKFERAVRHEILHVLGIGTDPSWGTSRDHADPHFAGERAIAAFEAAGGGDYLGLKVPIQGGHWRGSVMGCEAVSTHGCDAWPTSAISLAALIDLGWTVHLDKADPYTLPDP